MSSKSGFRPAAIVALTFIVITALPLTSAAVVSGPGVNGVAGGDSAIAGEVNHVTQSSAATTMQISSQVTFGFSKYDGSLSNGGTFSQAIEADGTSDQLSFTDWRIDEFEDPDFGVNLNNGGLDSVFADPAGDSFRFVSFTTQVYCGNTMTFDVVGYEDGSQVSGATQSFSISSSQGTTAVTRSVGFGSVDEVRFENYATDNGNQCLTIDDIIVDQAVSSNTQPSFSNLDANVVYEEAAGTPVVVDGDATVSDSELDGAGDYAGSTLTVERSSGAHGNDSFGFDTSAGTFSVSGSDLTTGGNVFASYTESGGTLTINFNSNQAIATSSLADDVLQGITYENTGDPVLVEYGLTVAFNDGDSGGALQTGESLSAEFDPALTPIASSTTLDFTDLGSKLANQDPVDARIIDELLFYDFDFGDAAESADIGSNELQLVHATSDPTTTGPRFESDANFTLDSIDIDNFDTSSQDVTVHGYRAGTQVASETLSMANESGYQTKDMDGLNSEFQFVDEVRFTTSASGSVGIDNLILDSSNELPTLDLNTSSGGSDSTATFVESDDQGTATTDGVVVTGPVTTSDADGTVESVTLTLDNPHGDTGEGLAVDTGSLAADLGFSTSANQITITRNTATNAELVAAIEAVRFQDGSDSPTETDRTVTVEVTDSMGGTTSATSTITVIGVNDQPTLLSTGNNPTFTEDSGPANIFTGTAVDTVESGQNVQSLTLTVANVTDGADETLVVDGSTVTLIDGTSVTTASNGLSATVSVTGSTATVTVGGGFSQSTATGLLDNLAYEYTGDDPSTTDNRTVTITSLVDVGGTANGGSDTVTLPTASNISLVSVNDAPTLTATGTNPTFTEGGAAVDAFSTVSADTVETGQNVQSLTLTVANVTDGADETLVVDGSTVTLTDGTSVTTASNGLSATVSVTGSTATVTVSGVVSPATATTVVDGLAYEHAGDNPSTANSRTVTITSLVDTGGTANGGSDTTPLSVASTISVTSVNDGPSISAPGSTLQPTEDTAFDLTSANEIQVADIDAASGTIEVTLGVDNGTLALGSTAGLTFESGSNATSSFTVSGTLSSINAALSTLSYQGDSDYYGADTVSVTVNDRGNTGTDPGLTGDASSEADSDSISLDVQSVPDAPTITAIANQTTDEDQTISGIAFTIDDAETAAGSLSLSFSTNDSLLIDSHSFGGSSASRTLEIVPTANASGSVLITINVSDGALSGEEDFLLEIQEVNDLPTITPAPSDVTVDEDGGVAPIDFDVDDLETPSSSLTVSATSDNQALVTDANLTISGSDTSRQLDVVLEPDQSGTANVTITVDDGTDTQSESFQLTVNAVNDAPVITNLPEGTAAEDSAYSYTPAVTDPDTGDTTSFTIANLPSWATFDTGTGVLSGTPANSDVGTYRDIEINVTDAAGENDTIGPFSIDVTNTNDAPTISGTPPGTVAQDSTYTFTPTANDVDTGDSLTFSIASKPSWATFNTSNGKLSGTPGNSDVGTHSAIEITVTDIAGESDTLGLFSIDVTNVNDSPVTTGNSYTTAEDTNLSVASPGVLDNDIDPDGDTMTADLVTGPTNGTLTLYANGSFDYAPEANFNSDDSFTYNVSDGSLTSTDETVTITVTPTNDAPWFENNVTLVPIRNNIASSNNDGSQIDSTELFGDEFEDVDEDDVLAGIVVTADAANSTNGTWEYSTDGGSNWYAIDDGNLSASRGLLLANTTRLRFASTQSFVGDPGNLTVHAVDDSGTTTFTNGTTRETYNTTTDGPTAIAAATSNTVGITVKNKRSNDGNGNSGRDTDPDPDDRIEMDIEDGDPDTPGTNVEFDGPRWLKSVSFDSEEVSGSIELFEYDEPPESTVERIRSQFPRQRDDTNETPDGETPDDESETNVVAVVDISPSTTDGKQSSATIVFTVSRSAVTNPKNLFVLHEREDGTWERLETTVQETTEDELTVVATADSFSQFALVEMAQQTTPTATATPSPTPEPETTTKLLETEAASPTPTPPPATATETDGQPGFGLVVAVISLLTVALLAARRRSR